MQLQLLLLCTCLFVPFSVFLFLLSFLFSEKGNEENFHQKQHILTKLHYCLISKNFSFFFFHSAFYNTVPKRQMVWCILREGHFNWPFFHQEKGLNCIALRCRLCGLHVTSFAPQPQKKNVNLPQSMTKSLQLKQAPIVALRKNNKFRLSHRKMTCKLFPKQDSWNDINHNYFNVPYMFSSISVSVTRTQIFVLLQFSSRLWIHLGLSFIEHQFQLIQSNQPQGMNVALVRGMK